MTRLNALSRNIPESATMAAAAAVSPHPDPIGLSIGEPSEPPPTEVLAAISKAIRDGHTRYGPAAGMPELRRAIADDQSTTTNRLVPDNVIVSSGGKPALIDALRCLVDPGDEVLILAPYWPSFAQQVQWCGAVPVIVRETMDGEDLVDPEAIRALCGARTRAIIVNSPNNPTAEVLTRQAIEKLVSIAREHDLWILSDEVYRSLSFAGPAPGFLDVEEILDRTIVVTSFSKRFSMTGLRVGAAIGAAETIAAMTRLTTASHTHTSTLSQHGALAALRLDGTWERERLEGYREKRDLAVARLSGLEGVTCSAPGCAMYVFPDFTDCLVRKGIEDDRRACDDLRATKGLSVVPGTVFGQPGSIRISYGIELPRLDEALNRLQDWARS